MTKYLVTPKATASLPALVGHSLSRASRSIAPLFTSTASASAVRIRQTLPGDELLPIALPDILGARLVACSVTAVDGGLVDVLVLLLVLSVVASAEAAALLALGEGHGGPGAHGVAAGQAGAASRGAVRVGQAASRDELEGLAVADVVLSGGVRGELGLRCREGEDGD